MEAPAAAAAANQDVAPTVTPLGSRDDESNMAYARRCVVMEIIKAETDYVTHLHDVVQVKNNQSGILHRCLLYTSPSPRDRTRSRMPSSA